MYLLGSDIFLILSQYPVIFVYLYLSLTLPTNDLNYNAGACVQCNGEAEQPHSPECLLEAVEAVLQRLATSQRSFSFKFLSRFLCAQNSQLRLGPCILT